MSERLIPTDVRDQSGSIQNTRRIIDVLTTHTSFSGTDAGELLFGLDRLEAEIKVEKVLKAPQVQDAHRVVSSMFEKGLVSKESADSFFAVLKDSATAEVLEKYVLPAINPAVINQDSQVTPKEINRREFLVGAGILTAGIGLISIFTIQEANRQESARQEAIRAEAARQEAVRKEVARVAEALRQAEAARQEAIRTENARHRKAADSLESLGSPLGDSIGLSRMAKIGFFVSNYSLAQEGLTAKFALPTKEVVPGSLGRNWSEQEKLIELGESRREAVEAAWDMILYYGATGKKILESKLDWTKTSTGAAGRFVYIGAFNSEGIEISFNGFTEGFGGNARVGVCTAL